MKQAIQQLLPLRHLWCASLLVATTAALLPAQTFTTLYSFAGPDGASPNAGLVQGPDGNLYGSSYAGGLYACNPFGTGCGTVFRITTAGVLTTLHSFCAGAGGCSDGNWPASGLVLANDGNLYGTTPYGGFGDGTIFALTTQGSLGTIFSFYNSAGQQPVGRLIEGDGRLYGTTLNGGANGSPCFGLFCGTVYDLTLTGTYTKVYNFCSQPSCTDGSGPYGALVQGLDGNFYGTTTTSTYSPSNGTIFKITPAGALKTLHTFCSDSGCPDGSLPYGALTEAIDGNFFGTTSGGGAYGAGTVFKITPSGVLTTLHSFCSQTGCPDGSGVAGDLTLGTDDDLYGVTTGGGAHAAGTVFRIAHTTGKFTTLYDFCPQTNCLDGATPTGGLLQDTDGKFYGTTSRGGNSNQGTVFKLSVSLAPFVKTVPRAGKVGTAISILGTDLTGATKVSFNGIGAAFTVVSPSLITATVPAGAASGRLEVMVANGGPLRGTFLVVP